MSIIDAFNPPYEDIVDIDYYKSKYSLPVTNDVNTQETQLKKLIIKCTDQVDVLCAGRPYEEWAKLDDNKPEDAKRKFWFRKAVCDYINYCVDVADIFVNKQFQSSGTLPFSLSASANDVNFEQFRLDIIKKLKQGDWYATLSGSNPKDIFGAELNQVEYNKWLTWLLQYLKTIFKTIDNTNQFANGLVLSNNDITTVKNITAYSNQSEISGFKIHLDNNLITTEFLTSEVKEINVEANNWTFAAFRIQIEGFNQEKDYLLQCDQFNVSDADSDVVMPGFIQFITRDDGSILVYTYFLPYRTGTYQFVVHGKFNILKR